MNQIKANHVPAEKELNELSNKVKAISTKVLINGYKILNGSRYFSSATLQIHLSIVYIKKYFKLFTNFRLFVIGLSEESDEIITTSDSNFAATLINCYPMPDIRFNKNCIINDLEYIYILVIKQIDGQEIQKQILRQLIGYLGL